MMPDPGQEKRDQEVREQEAIGHLASIRWLKQVIADRDSEIERITRCYESATGKDVCGSGGVVRVECKEMTKLREQNKQLKKQIFQSGGEVE